MDTRLILLFLLPALVLAQGYGFDRGRRDASSQHIDQSDESTHQHRRHRSIGHGTHATHEWLSDVNVEWLDADQLEAVKSAGDSVSKVYKLRHYYNQLPSAIEKVEAAKKIVGKCYDWLADVTTQAEREALFSLHHHDHNACKVKVGEYMQRLPEPKQTQLAKYWSFCEHVWYDSHTADTTRGLSHDHDGSGAHSSSHPGYSPGAGQHHPSHHQHQSPIQEPIPGRRSKRTIDEPQGKTLEDYFQTYLSWLSEEQKEQLREMKTEGKSRSDLQSKIFEFYEAATGDTKETATQQLQGGCRTLLRSTIGEERADELKQMKESGTPIEELAKKVESYLGEVTDEKGKATVAEYGPSCRKILGVTGGTSRRRRDHHEGHEGHEAHHGNHTLEDYFKTHLSWLTDEQKEVLRTMKTEGKSRSELQAKVFEFYDAATGEQKEKATQQMQGGCRELIRSVIGEEKAQELKQMKESGAATADIAKKAEEFLAAVTDEHKKAIVAEYKPSCKKIFGVAVSRRRRDHHLVSDEGHHHKEKGIEEQTLEEHLKHHLSWLSDEQKEALRAMKADGKSKREIQQKVLEYYEAASGATKEKATEELQCGCRMLLRSVIGDEKAQELKQMKESGVSMAELATKADDFLNQVNDEGKKSLVTEYGPACKKLFGLTTAPQSRRRRSNTREADNNAVGDGEEGDGGEGTEDDTNARRADDEFENRLSSQYHWLGDEHKNELRSQRIQGSSDSAIQDKVLEYFHLSSDDVKEVARSLLLNGCERLMVKIFGAEKADALKLMREQGSGSQEMHEKMREYASEIEDEGEKAEVLQHGSSCQKIFEAVPAGTPSTRRRRALRSPLSQREEEPKSTVAESPTHSQCRKILLDVLGEDRVTELKERQLAGASHKWLQIKAHYYLEELRWEGADRVGQFTDQCREVMGIAPAGYGDDGRKVQKKVGTPWAYVLPVVEEDEEQ